MCRLFGFHARAPSAVHRSLVLESNALRAQSRAHPDGWGLAFYDQGTPQLARKAMAAFEDEDFASICRFISSDTVIAHVRRASVGNLRVENTHPFVSGRWVMAHNGHLPGFTERRAQFEAPIDPERRAWMNGDTDSERYFAIFLTRLARRIGDIDAPRVEVEAVAAALEETLEHLEACCGSEADAPALNVVVTNGSLLLAYRRGRPLHFSTHKTRCPERSSCNAFEEKRCERASAPGELVSHLVVSSEPLGEGDVWQEVGEGELVAVDAEMRLHRRALAPGREDTRRVTSGGVS